MISLAGLIARSLAGNVLATSDKVQRNVVAGAVIAVLLLTAYIAAVFAGWFVLTPVYGPAPACALIAAATSLLALIAWGITAELNRRARERALLERRARAASLDGQLLHAAVGTLPGLVRESPVATLVFVAGLTYALMKSRRAESDAKSDWGV